jgi:hypothetical protein
VHHVSFFFFEETGGIYTPTAFIHKGEASLSTNFLLEEAQRKLREREGRIRKHEKKRRK